MMIRITPKTRKGLDTMKEFTGMHYGQLIDKLVSKVKHPEMGLAMFDYLDEATIKPEDNGKEIESF